MKKFSNFIFILFLLFLSSCSNSGNNGGKPNNFDRNKKEYKVVIIGSGPAGLTAGVYTSRAGLDTLVIEGDNPGGILTESPCVENWPGEVSISGYDLMSKISDHAQNSGCSMLTDIVTKVDFSSQPYSITVSDGTVYKTDSVIISTGVKRRKLDCPGSEKYWMKGISACATCDAAMFKEKKVVVVGGGDTALIEANHLSSFSSEVIIIRRRDSFRSVDPIKDVVLKNKKIKVIDNSNIKEIVGNNSRVTGVIVENKFSKKISKINTDGVFVAIGFEPDTNIFNGEIELDNNGYPKVYENTKTSKQDVFIAGDIAHLKHRQAIVAAGDGCKAALDCVDSFALKH